MLASYSRISSLIIPRQSLVVPLYLSTLGSCALFDSPRQQGQSTRGKVIQVRLTWCPKRREQNIIIIIIIITCVAMDQQIVSIEQSAFKEYYEKCYERAAHFLLRIPRSTAFC
mmetsp:Transcript_14988/g.21964  ORF Transcript_14988/g.21964 Transcript_14988/m.21964 type:complete len:113 (+) Transcript_14988:61-399(+)